MTAPFFQQAKPGWYASLLQEGSFSTEDEILFLDRAPENISIADIWLYSAQLEPDKDIGERVKGLKVLPGFWKDRIYRT